MQPHLRLYLEAFYDLNDGRQIGDVPQPLLGSEIYKHIDEHEEFNPEARQVFFKRIRALDRAFLSHQAERIAKARSQKSS